MRDGVAPSDSEAQSGAVASDDPDGIQAYIGNENVFAPYTMAHGIMGYKGSSARDIKGDPTTNIDKDSSRVTQQLIDYGDVEFGFKYSVLYADNDTWVRILYTGTKYPEVLVIRNALADHSQNGPDQAKAVTTEGFLQSYSTGDKETWSYTDGWPIPIRHGGKRLTPTRLPSVRPTTSPKYSLIGKPI